MPKTTEFRFDVFLSHSAKDKAVVRTLAERLQQDGLKVWFDEWEIQPGDSIPAKIEEGLEHSRVLVLCMSAQAFGSAWTQLEAGTFRFRDPLNQERRFIPLRLDDAPIKGSLAQFFYISWHSAHREQGYAKLLEACRTGEPLVQTEHREDAGWNLPRLEEVVIDRESRHEFSKSTRDTIAQRVGMRCSNPACRKLTIGPHSDPTKSFNFGVAVDIKATAADGPRHSPSRSKPYRASIENGIWLCQNCARLVDSDIDRYTVDLLRTWKREAEKDTDVAANSSAGDRAELALPIREKRAGGRVVKLTALQMVFVFFFCSLLGAVTFRTHFVVGSVFLSLSAAVGLFGFIGGVAHVENRWGKFGGSVGAFVATLLIILKFGGRAELVDIKGSVYVDGQPATKAVITLLETAFSDNRREINEGNPGFFEFRGVGAFTGKVKFRIDVDAPINLPPEVVERNFDPSHGIRIDLPKPSQQLANSESDVDFSPEELAMQMRHFAWRLEVPLTGLIPPGRLSEMFGTGEANLSFYDFQDWRPFPPASVQFVQRPQGLGKQAGKLIETALGGTGVSFLFYWTRTTNSAELAYQHGFRFTDRRSKDTDLMRQLPAYAAEHMLPEFEVAGGNIHTFGICDDARLRFETKGDKTSLFIEWTTESGSQLILSDFKRVSVKAQIWEASGIPGIVRRAKVAEIQPWVLEAYIDYRWRVKCEPMRWIVDPETGERKTILSRFRFVQ